MASFDPKNFDTSVKPTDDFFAYVNNKWIKNNPIPAEESRWGSFTVLRVQVEHQLKELIDGLLLKDDLAKGSNAKKIRDFYETAMDTEKLNHLKNAPLAELMLAVDGIKTSEDVVRVTGYLHRRGINVWWQPSVEQDEKQSELMALHLYQGGLGLPDRDYYLKDDEKNREIRSKYLLFVKALLELSGVLGLKAGQMSEVILKIEKRLAEASMTRVERRDIEKQYNKITLTELATLTPKINWTLYFKEIQVPDLEYVIVCQKEFLREAENIIKTSPLEEIKTYLKWHVLQGMARYLCEDFEREAFNFYDKIFGGATQMKPRFRRVIQVASNLLDEAMGELYVEHYFSKQAKEKITALVGRLLAAYRERILRLDWMGQDTKEKALKKLSAVSLKLGYPDKWKDFSALTVGTNSYAENFTRAYMFAFDREIVKIGKPVDRDEWHMPPQTVNAFYNQTLNEIVFPAAFLQSPFFDDSADEAVNFGAIGTVIGHELTHGFDDQGSLFDAQGNINNWWTDEDKKLFHEKVNCLADQFNLFEPLPGVFVNGKLTLGENIADLGGILIAYDALQLAPKNSKSLATIQRLTDNQRFFVSYTTIWCEYLREELLRMALNIDPHAPSFCRVNGPLSNLTEFYEAFGCREGDRMWRKPEDRVSIW